MTCSRRRGGNCILWSW